MTPSISMIVTSVLVALQMTVIPISSSVQYALTLMPSQQTVKRGNAISITVEVKNITNSDIYIEKNDYPEERYFVDVKDAGGTRREMTDNYKKTVAIRHWESAHLPKPQPSADKNGNITFPLYQGRGAPSLIVKPGEAIEEVFSPNKLYKFDKLGVYLLHIERIEGQNTIKSNTVKITVTN